MEIGTGNPAYVSRTYGFASIGVWKRWRICRGKEDSVDWTGIGCVGGIAVG